MFTQQHCYDALKTLYPGGILVPEAHAMSIAPRQGNLYRCFAYLIEENVEK
jgi:hypothetical protein